jgi:succinylarginine dihydrolase
MSAREYNFDGLIGPTHNYAGLSYGNVASAAHQNQTSHPRAAALQGLAKMKCLVELGIPQAILPPQLRPDTSLLRRLGFAGKSPADLIHAAYQVSPQLVAQCYSAANMWTANAATVSPSADCADVRVHLTPANLGSTLHRSLEANSTASVLHSLFPDPNHFTVHSPLPGAMALTDEGAANHTRLCDSYANPAIEIFVYGSDPLDPRVPRPQRFPARQTLLASESIARHHRLDPALTFFWQQTPEAIDAGVFHNDVIAVGNQNVFLCHEMAFLKQEKRLESLQQCFAAKFSAPLHLIEFSSAEFPLEDAVKSYLFNSQLVTRPDGGMTMICPIECEEIPTAKQATQRILAEPNPVDEIRFLNLRQSMNNGGGPACLRLRVVLTEAEAAQIHPAVLLTPSLADALTGWINQHYRDSLAPGDVLDPNLIEESSQAQQQLAEILQLETLCRELN